MTSIFLVICCFDKHTLLQIELNNQRLNFQVNDKDRCQTQGIRTTVQIVYFIFFLATFLILDILGFLEGIFQPHWYGKNKNDACVCV